MSPPVQPASSWTRLVQSRGQSPTPEECVAPSECMRPLGPSNVLCQTACPRVFDLPNSVCRDAVGSCAAVNVPRRGRACQPQDGRTGSGGQPGVARPLVRTDMTAPTAAVWARVGRSLPASGPPGPVPTPRGCGRVAPRPRDPRALRRHPADGGCSPVQGWRSITRSGAGGPALKVSTAITGSRARRNSGVTNASRSISCASAFPSAAMIIPWSRAR
jgi:hypothetical protein